MYAVDLHSHTRFFHGRRSLGDRFDPIGFRLLAATARVRGLDGIATTNHDYYTPFESDAVDVIPGIEVSTTRGHVLVVGPDPPRETKPGELTPAETVEMAHDRGCAAIMAHPFRGDLAEVEAPFDAVELNGKHPRSHPWVVELAKRRDLPLVGGSDAHYPVEVGRAYTALDVERVTPESVVEAIREGRVSARVRHGSTDRAVRRLYRAIHDHNDRLARPAWADDLNPDPAQFPGLDAQWRADRE